PMAFGGPYLGILACREEFLRRMPGRLAGQTVDRRGRRCWVLTLQTREQHIRRDKATSNICTNQGLFALRAAIYLSLLGPEGLREAAELSTQKAHYAAERIAQLERFELAMPGPFFKEFVVRDRSHDVPSVLAAARDQGILAGIPLGTWYPNWDDCFLVAVTEQRTKSEIDRLVQVLANCPVPVATRA
ncbi:MAG TPA: glycine dehydrogenase, partial [Pirellulaceae bacterium]